MNGGYSRTEIIYARSSFKQAHILNLSTNKIHNIDEKNI